MRNDSQQDNRKDSVFHGSRALNAKQEEAAAHFQGAALILAGPGSGKTTVITERTRRLIEEHGISPSHILVITFTKAAALQMQRRFEIKMGEDFPVTFGTFHSVFFRILKYAYQYKADNILGESEKIDIFKEIIESLGIEVEEEKDFIENITAEISIVKAEMKKPEQYSPKNCSRDIFIQIFKGYENKLRQKNKIDFDDMLFLCYELLRARADILSAWQKKYQYILIDEFQDISKVQYEVIKMLCAPENHLFIVGDDDQSIYGFRGARPEIMLNFEKDFPNAKKICLDINYRCAPDIVARAGRLIANNKQRFSKELCSGGKYRGLVTIEEYTNQKEQNERIVQRIQEYRQQGLDYSQIAVLFRTNLGPRLLVSHLMEWNIPFRMKDAMPNIYNHWIAQNILSYIYMAQGDRRRSHFLQIMNRPKRYISREMVNGEEIDFYFLRERFSDKPWIVQRIEKLEFDLDMIEKMKPYAAIKYIRSGVGYEEYIKEYGEYKGIDEMELLQVLEELQELARPYKTFEQWFMGIEEYTREIERQNKKQQNQSDSVEIMTLHGAKGLEYDVVLIPDVNEGNIPYHKAVLEEEIEEERRLLYVGMTRAKYCLHLSYTDEKFEKKISASRFLADMEYDSSLIQKGMKIVHKKYGEGVVRGVEGGKAIIWFKKLRKELVFDMKFALSNHIIQPIEKLTKNS